MKTLHDLSIKKFNWENSWGNKYSFQLPINFNYCPISRLETHEKSVQITDTDHLSNYVPFVSVLSSPLKAHIQSLEVSPISLLRAFPSMRLMINRSFCRILAETD